MSTTFTLMAAAAQKQRKERSVPEQPVAVSWMARRGCWSISAALSEALKSGVKREDLFELVKQKTECVEAWSCEHERQNSLAEGYSSENGKGGIS